MMWALGSDCLGCNAIGHVHGSTYSVTGYLVPSPRSIWMCFFPHTIWFPYINDRGKIGRQNCSLFCKSFIFLTAFTKHLEKPVFNNTVSQGWLCAEHLLAPPSPSWPRFLFGHCQKAVLVTDSSSWWPHHWHWDFSNIWGSDSNRCHSSVLNGRVRHHPFILFNICLKKNDATI